MNPMAFIPLTSAIISFVFAGLVFKRYLAKHHTHNLLWAIGMLFYGIGGACEAIYGFFGWNPLVFRLWYLFGAILVAAWLGQGTIFLLAKANIARILMAVLGAASIFAAYRVFTAQLDPAGMISSLHTGSELSGGAILSPGVRSLTPFFNIYGTLALVGGALYSAFLFFRKRVLLHRVVGNVLIAAGAILPAFGGSFSRLGIPGALYISELLGAIIIFIGFLRATSPMAAAKSAVPEMPVR
jgi:hypothetical protein